MYIVLEVTYTFTFVIMDFFNILSIKLSRTQQNFT